MGWLLFAFVGLFACSTDEPEVDVGAPCNASGECSAPLVCALDTCHYRCQDVGSCPLDTLDDGTQVSQRCVQLTGVGICLTKTEGACTAGGGTAGGGACAEGLVCAPDGFCRNDCAISRECVPGQTCAGGVCMEIAESSDDGGETPADGGDMPADGGETPADGGETPAEGGGTADAGTGD